MMTTPFKAENLTHLMERLDGFGAFKVLEVDRQTVMFDLINSKVDIDALAYADWLDVSHDVAGIVNNIDRSVTPAVLDPTFVPRVGFSKVGA